MFPIPYALPWTGEGQVWHHCQALGCPAHRCSGAEETSPATGRPCELTALLETPLGYLSRLHINSNAKVGLAHETNIPTCQISTLWSTQPVCVCELVCLQPLCCAVLLWPFPWVVTSCSTTVTAARLILFCTYFHWAMVCVHRCSVSEYLFYIFLCAKVHVCVRTYVYMHVCMYVCVCVCVCACVCVCMCVCECVCMYMNI